MERQTQPVSDLLPADRLLQQRPPLGGSVGLLVDAQGAGRRHVGPHFGGRDVRSDRGQRERHGTGRYGAGGGQAAAVRTAATRRGRLTEFGVERGQPCRERRQLGGPLIGVSDPGGDRRQHTFPDRRAHPLLPHARQVADLLQRQPQQLPGEDERQPLHRLLAIHPATRRGALRGQQPSRFIEPQRRRRHSNTIRQLRDAKGSHGSTVNLRPDSKVNTDGERILTRPR